MVFVTLVLFFGGLLLVLSAFSGKPIMQTLQGYIGGK